MRLLRDFEGPPAPTVRISEDEEIAARFVSRHCQRRELVGAAALERDQSGAQPAGKITRDTRSVLSGRRRVARAHQDHVIHIGARHAFAP